MTTKAELLKNTKISLTTMGHVDCGKSTLSGVLNGIYNGNLQGTDFFDRGTEKARGVTIDLCSINALVDNKNPETGEPDKIETTIIDAPGHRDFAKNTAKGACSSDCAILLINATDGVLIETHEHLNMALLSFGVGSHLSVDECKKKLEHKRMAVVINKTDLLAETLDNDEESIMLSLEMIEEEITELLEKKGFNLKHVRVLKTSAFQAQKALEEKTPAGHQGTPEVTKIKEFYDELVNDIYRNRSDVLNRPLDAPFRMDIEKTVMTTRGMAVTGIVRAGSAKVGDTIELIGPKTKRKQAVIISMEIFHKAVESVSAGDNLGMVLRGISNGDVRSGDVVSAPGSINLVKSCMATVCFFTLDEMGIGARRSDAIKLGYESDAMFNSTSTNVKVVGYKKDGKMILLSEQSRNNPDNIIPRGESVTLLLDFCNSHGGVIMPNGTTLLFVSSKLKEGFALAVETYSENIFVTNGKKKGIGNYKLNPNGPKIQAA